MSHMHDTGSAVYERVVEKQSPKKKKKKVREKKGCDKGINGAVGG